YFEEFYGADSGMLAACHLIAALAESAAPASRLVADYDRSVHSGEINFTVTDPDAVLAEFADDADRLPPNTLAGLDGSGPPGDDRFVQSGEIPFTVTDPDAVLAEFAADADRFPPNTVDDLDGIGLQGEDWWVNLRKSNTEPLVRLNVEAADHGQMEELVRRV